MNISLLNENIKYQILKYVSSLIWEGMSNSHTATNGKPITIIDIMSVDNIVSYYCQLIGINNT